MQLCPCAGSACSGARYACSSVICRGGQHLSSYARKVPLGSKLFELSSTCWCVEMHVAETLQSYGSAVQHHFLSRTGWSSCPRNVLRTMPCSSLRRRCSNAPCLLAQVGTLSGRFVERVQREQAVPAGASKLGFGAVHYSVLEAQGVARCVLWVCACLCVMRVRVCAARPCAPCRA